MSTEKTGFGITGGEASEGVVLTLTFSSPTVEDAMAFAATVRGDKKAKKEAPAKGKPAKGKPAKEEDDEEEDSDEDESDDDEEEDDEEEDDEEDESDDDEEEDDEEEDDEEEEKSAKKGKGDTGPTKLKVTSELKAAKNFREIISLLMKMGFKGSSLVKATVALKDKLKPLATIDKLEERVVSAEKVLNGKK